MINLFNVGVTGATGGGSFVVDSGFIVDRVANILRRPDMKPEILYWLNLAQWRLTQEVDFPELLTDASAQALTATVYSYDLPTDWQKPSNLVYEASYASPVWKKSLTPWPGGFYGEPVDVASKVNVVSVLQEQGDPAHYLIRGHKYILLPVPSTETIPANVYWSYYKLPADLTNSNDVPEIDKQWRPYLIWLTLLWGKMALEQQDPTKLMVWDKKIERIIGYVKSKVETVKNPRETYVLPEIGLEDADEIF